MREVFDSELRQMLLSEAEVFVSCCGFLDLIDAGFEGSFKVLTLEKIFHNLPVSSIIRQGTVLRPLLFIFPKDDMNDGSSKSVSWSDGGGLGTLHVLR